MTLLQEHEATGQITLDKLEMIQSNSAQRETSSLQDLVLTVKLLDKTSDLNKGS